MSELKPCPEYQEEMNELFRMKKQLLGPQGCSCQSQQRNEWKAHCLSAGIYALSQLGSAQPDNAPLTLEQLRYERMGYINVKQAVETELKAWSFSTTSRGIEEKFEFDGIGELTAEDYGKTWLAYRRKPEGSESDGQTI